MKRPSQFQGMCTGLSWMTLVQNSLVLWGSMSLLVLTFDNVDFKVLVNIILQNHRNSDMHWIAHFLTFDRVPSEHLDDSKPLVECIKDFKNTEYLLNKDDLQKLRSDFIIFFARVLKEFFGFLDSVKGMAIPEHIPHRYNWIARHNIIHTYLKVHLNSFVQLLYFRSSVYMENVVFF